MYTTMTVLTRVLAVGLSINLTIHALYDLASSVRSQHRLSIILKVNESNK